MGRNSAPARPENRGWFRVDTGATYIVIFTI
jgi:hypothetical protein